MILVGITARARDAEPIHEYSLYSYCMFSALMPPFLWAHDILVLVTGDAAGAGADADNDDDDAELVP